MTVVSTALLAAIATRVPNMTLANALGLVEDFERFGYRNTESERTRTLYDLTTVEGRVEYTKTLPGVMSHLPDYKIRAIKALREAFASSESTVQYSGLKECKDVIDLIQPSRYI